jgi:hypothetical protein
MNGIDDVDQNGIHKWTPSGVFGKISPGRMDRSCLGSAYQYTCLIGEYNEDAA